MPKMKSSSGARKRFKISKNGDVKFHHCNKRHILTKKATKRKRQLRGCGILRTADANQIKDLLPYG
jgi:large subunit ribosomal protein L35